MAIALPTAYVPKASGGYFRNFLKVISLLPLLTIRRSHISLNFHADFAEYLGSYNYDQS